MRSCSNRYALNPMLWAAASAFSPLTSAPASRPDSSDSPETAQRTVRHQVVELDEPDRDTLRDLATQQLLEKAFNINGGALRDYLRDALGASRRIDNRDLPVNNARDLLALSHVIELGSADHAAAGFRLRIEPTDVVRDEHYFVHRDGFLLELEQDDTTARPE